MVVGVGEGSLSEDAYIDGIAGGAVSGALVSLLVLPGLMKIAKTTITSGKLIIPPRSIDAGGSVTLSPSTMYKFAVILFHGDGDPQVQLTLTVGGNTYTLRGDEQAIELVANEAVEITAVNTDTANPRNAMTIEIAYLAW